MSTDSTMEAALPDGEPLRRDESGPGRARRPVMRRRAAALAAAALAVLVTSGAAVAVAAKADGPQTDPVAATFEFAPVKAMQRVCAGRDGAYLEMRATYRGTMTGDPRLTGEIEVTAHHLLNVATGLGTSEGTWDVREPATNRLKVKGKFVGIFTEGTNFHAFGRASVKDEHPAGNHELFATFESVVNPVTGAVAGQLGGTAADPRTPAVIQQGTCTGPYEHVLG